MAITYAGFATSISGLTITGVNTKLSVPPSVDSSGNYPMSFPRIPTATREVVTFEGGAGLKSVSCELVIVIERDSLSTPVTKYAATVAMIDAIDTALATEMAANQDIVSWTITSESNEYGWVLVATVEGRG